MNLSFIPEHNLTINDNVSLTYMLSFTFSGSITHRLTHTHKQSFKVLVVPPIVCRTSRALVIVFGEGGGESLFGGAGGGSVWLGIDSVWD